MYYPQQSPGITHKLTSHHDQSAWGRAAAANQSILVPPGSQPVGVGMPPLQSQGYPLYTNGGLQHHHPGHHHLTHAQLHHQNTLSHYPSPPNGHALQQQQQQQQPHMLAQGSPVTQMISPHWQQQLLKCDMIRSSRSPHHRARANAVVRAVPKSAIPITNPNAKLAAAIDKVNGASKDAPTAPSESASTPGSPSPNGAANHPSSVAAPVAEAPRLSAMKPPENTWNSLDMGGVNIKNLPPTSGLFSFTFLINLYLNHNSLTTVPPEIAKLRHLELLDLSGNNLATLPPELGMLTQLKELYVFDNRLTDIPPELGTLHQLQTLGIEGNPMDNHIKTIVQKDGTPALISYLRDNCPAPPPPPERQWKYLLTEQERQAVANDPNYETVKVLSYNILCERYATERLYGYTPLWALAWSYRKQLILKEVMEHDTDFICLQEVDVAQYEEYFLTNLEDQGYSGVYWPKSRANRMSESDRRLVDGCAVFFKTSRFQLVEKQLLEFHSLAMARTDFSKGEDHMFTRVLNKDHIGVICLMEEKVTGTRFIVSNVHIHWDPALCDVKLVQTALLLDSVEKSASRFAKYPPPPPKSALTADGDSSKPDRPPPHYSDGTKIPTIICGDFNSTPGSSVYDFIATGTLPPDHPDFLSYKYGKLTSEGMKHRLNMKSAYAAPGMDGAEEHSTNHTPSFKGEIDYVWYSASNLAVNAVLTPVDHRYLEKCVGFPNPHFPSDHICIGAEFRVKPPRENPPRSAAPSMSAASPSPISP